MKAFFKESDKIIINSMTYDEALVGKMFLDKAEGKTLKAEQRNDINDDFDGLVVTIGGEAPSEEEIQKRIDEAVKEAEEARIKEFTIDLDKEVYMEDRLYYLSNQDNVTALNGILACPTKFDTPKLKLIFEGEIYDVDLIVYGFDIEVVENPTSYISFAKKINNIDFLCEFSTDNQSYVRVTQE